MERVPLVDLQIQQEQIRDELNEGLAQVLETSSFVLGPAVRAFEKSYARFEGVKHCVGAGNGSDAIEFMLRALGVGAGDEVIVPTNASISAALAVVRTGAKPVLVDCDVHHHLIDPDQVEESITKNTQAVLAVHQFGQMAPMRALGSITERAGVALLEDASHAHGARQGGAAAGTLGLAAATSFSPEMNLGAYGDAGAVITDSEVIARGVEALCNQGREGRYPVLGFESRLDSLQAAVLSAKLKHLARWNDQRRTAAAYYDHALAALDWIERPSVAPGNEHVWHVYAVRVPERDRVLAALRESGIDAAVHYPTPIHLSGRFADLGGFTGSLPVAEQLASEMISLPIFPGISEAQQARVVAALAHIAGLLKIAA
jgi:dTDP-4-amino-4,6-dideoxygalactose transaminase